jgi:hypothetical protein
MADPKHPHTAEHPTYRFLARRDQIEPGRPTFLIVGGVPLLAHIEDTELRLVELEVTDKHGASPNWENATIEQLHTGLLYQGKAVRGNTTADSLHWLETKADTRQGGAFYITSSLDVDWHDGSTTMGGITARGAVELCFEWDGISAEEQQRRVEQLHSWGLETTTNTSGNQSTHCHIHLTELASWESVMPVWRMGTALMSSDVCVVSKARRMRLPGLTRRNGSTCNEQKLLHLSGKAYAISEVLSIFTEQFAARGWTYGDERWKPYKQVQRRLSARRPTRWNFDSANEVWTIAEHIARGWRLVTDVSARESDFELPPDWCCDENQLGRQIRLVCEQLFDKFGVVGAYELALQGEIDPSFGSFAFPQFDLNSPPSVVSGRNPFSPTNHSGTSFAIFPDNRGWFDRKFEEGGTLPEFLIHFSPGVIEPEEPSPSELRCFLAWLCELGGIDPEVIAKRASDGKHGDVMSKIEELVQDSINAEGNPLETAAVTLRAQELRLNEGKLLSLKMKALTGELRKSGAMSADELINHPDNIESDVIFDFLRRGLTGFVGSSHAGKTTLFSFLASLVINGRSLVIGNKEHPTAKGKVLVISSDSGTAQIKKDLLKQGVDVDLPAYRPWIRFMTKTFDEMSLIVKTMQDFQPDLTLMDSLTSMKPSGVKFAEEAISEPLYALAKMNGTAFPKHAIWVAIHTKKGQPKVWLGSETIKSALDSMAIYATGNGEQGGDPRARYLDFEEKCRLGNHGRRWAVNYEELMGRWTFCELTGQDGAPSSVSTELRDLVERTPVEGWHRSTEFLRAIKAPDEYLRGSANRTIRRHLKAIPELVEWREVEDRRTRKKVAEFQIRPAVLDLLIRRTGSVSGFNTIGLDPHRFSEMFSRKETDQEAEEAPVASTTPESAQKPVQGQAGVSQRASGKRRGRKVVEGQLPLITELGPEGSASAPAPASVAVVKGPVESKVVEPERLLPWSLGQLPGNRESMAVLVEGVWRNGYVFWGMKGDRIELGYQGSGGHWYPKQFPADPEVVRRVGS